MKTETMIFGVHPILEALESGKTLDKVLMSKGASGDNMTKIRELLKKEKIEPKMVPLEKLNSLTRKNHQGIVAFISPIDFFSIEVLLPKIFEKKKNPLILILDRISDVRNFGAIVRTAECTGVDAIVIPTKEAAPITEDAIKTSAGALFRVPICKEADLKRIVQIFQNQGIKVVCATEKTAMHLYEADFTGPTAIVMGSEDNGVSNALLRTADENCSLPIIGEISSLNVSVACGAFLYEVVRQRG